MNTFAIIATVLALLASAIVAGVFFAFSSFVMKALALLPAAHGMAAMQSINVVVINPAFLGTFLGAAVLSVVVAGLALAQWGSDSAIFLLLGALAYLGGTFLVTVAGNVPLNQQLAAARVTDVSGEAVWKTYLVRWTRWNHVRTVAAFLAAVMFLAGLLAQAGG